MRMPNGVSLIAKYLIKLGTFKKTILGITGHSCISGCHTVTLLNSQGDSALDVAVLHRRGNKKWDVFSFWARF